MKKAVKAVEAVIADGFVTLFSVTRVFPAVWAIYSPLKTDQEFSLDILGLPKKLIFDNYVWTVKKGNVGSYLTNSMFSTLVTVAVVIVITFVIGYCLPRFKFRGRTLVYYMFLSGMLIPIYALPIPTFVEFKSLGLLNKRYTLILPYIVFALPVVVFLVENLVASVSIEIGEMTRIDGNSFPHTMFVIVMPMYRSVLSTSVILILLDTWNEFPLALILIEDSPLRTVPIGLTNSMGSYTINHLLTLAALVVSTLSMVIMYPLFYSQIMKGMTAGATKG